MRVAKAKGPRARGSGAHRVLGRQLADQLLVRHSDRDMRLHQLPLSVLAMQDRGGAAWMREPDHHSLGSVPIARASPALEG